MSSMLRPIESMRILRAKIVSLGGVAPRSCAEATEPSAPAQSPATPTIAAKRAQRRFPIITHLRSAALTPAIPHPALGARQILPCARRHVEEPQPARPQARAQAPSTPPAHPDPD